MCPSCVSAAASVIAGVASTGGIAAMAVAAFRRRSDRVQSQSQHAPVETETNTSYKETDDAAAENRNPR